MSRGDEPTVRETLAALSSKTKEPGAQEKQQSLEGGKVETWGVPLLTSSANISLLLWSSPRSVWLKIHLAENKGHILWWRKRCGLESHMTSEPTLLPLSSVTLSQDAVRLSGSHRKLPSGWFPLKHRPQIQGRSNKYHCISYNSSIYANPSSKHPFQGTPFPSYTKTLKPMDNLELSTSQVCRVPCGSEPMLFHAILGTLELFQGAWALCAQLNLHSLFLLSMLFREQKELCSPSPPMLSPHAPHQLWGNSPFMLFLGFWSRCCYFWILPRLSWGKMPGGHVGRFCLCSLPTSFLGHVSTGWFSARPGEGQERQEEISASPWLLHHNLTHLHLSVDSHDLQNKGKCPHFSLNPGLEVKRFLILSAPWFSESVEKEQLIDRCIPTSVRDASTLGDGSFASSKVLALPVQNRLYMHIPTKCHGNFRKGYWEIHPCNVSHIFCLWLA